MGKETGISWCDSTWNVARGCAKVDADCLYCYMYRDSFDSSRYNPLNVVKTKTVFNLPLRIKEPSRIFVSSLTDFFHQDIDSYRDEAWEIIRKCPQHTFQILTKRPERIIEHLPKDWGKGWNNVWLGTSIGHQKALHRYFDLIKVPAIVRFISFEPLHEEIDFTEIDPSFIDWIIIGGESGNESGKYRYRPCKLEWIDKIIKEFEGYSKIFIKQYGTYLAKELKLKSRHGSDIAEFIKEHQRREFPNA